MTVGSKLKRAQKRAAEAKKPNIEDEEQAVHTADPSPTQDVNPESSSSEDEQPVSGRNAYGALLSSFAGHGRPTYKKRKLNEADRYHTVNDQILESINGKEASISKNRTADVQENGNGVASVDDEKEDEIEAFGLDEDDDNDTDPFKAHFANPDENELSSKLKALNEENWNVKTVRLPIIGKLVHHELASDGSNVPSDNFFGVTSNLGDIHLKSRLIAPAKKVIGSLDNLQQELASPIFTYKSLLLGTRTVSNAQKIRDITSLHLANHIFKTRDRVLKNTARLSHPTDAKAGPVSQDSDRLRDQGFTRPKVLVLLESREQCVRWVKSLTAVSAVEQLENYKRFSDSFAQADENPQGFSNKPAEFRELFEGNTDNDFRLGLKFTRKALKFFSSFLQSDIILASPLGLRRAMKPPKDKRILDRTGEPSAILSSIEIVVLDQADASLMQNFAHVKYIFSHLNEIPKQAPPGCDFSRIRPWYLDGQAKHLRQTLVFSSYVTPDLHGLFSQHMRNVAGRVKTTPEYDGCIAASGLPIRQAFHRFDCAVAESDPDMRFKHFVVSILPSIVRLQETASASARAAGNDSDPADGLGVLLFIPTYFDFTRLRNHFSNDEALQNITWGTLTEHDDVRSSQRARSHFAAGRTAVLLYTGRAHHFRRYMIKGVRRVVFYGPPDNPAFYRDLAGECLRESIEQGHVAVDEARAQLLFSRWDALALERIVGTKRMGKMLGRDNSTVGDVFEFR